MADVLMETLKTYKELIGEMPFKAMEEVPEDSTNSGFLVVFPLGWNGGGQKFLESIRGEIYDTVRGRYKQDTQRGFI